MANRFNHSVLAIVVLLILLPSVLTAQRISFAGGCGVWRNGSGVPDSLLTGEQITLFLRYENPDPIVSWNIVNGFEIYSPDGATWSGPVRGDTLNGEIPRSNWDLNFAMNVFDGNGAPDADTIGIIGTRILGAGLPPGFNGVPYGIRIGSFDDYQSGHHLCIDSAWFRPAGTWKWAAQGGVTVAPAWGGPYCLTIYHLPCKRVAGKAAPVGCGCCSATTGNVDGDPGDITDVSDLSALVDYLFGSGQISSCPEENNVDGSGDGVVDLSDLTKIVDFLFSSSDLPACPVSCRQYYEP
ncbi:MAG: hypothetical protein AB1644_06795 [Candidatus Zixiibacteriota bacterium]